MLAGPNGQAVQAVRETLQSCAEAIDRDLQLDHVVQTYGMYHNEYRLHQGWWNRPLGQRADPPLRELDEAPIHCRQWLGGLLKHYERRAA
ncbi:MAG: hypothetical protein ACOC93_03210 [Planctomycetota bacterium]